MWKRYRKYFLSVNTSVSFLFMYYKTLSNIWWPHLPDFIGGYQGLKMEPRLLYYTMFTYCCHPIYNVFLLFSYILLKRVVCSQLIFYKHLSLWHVERRTLLISFRYIFLFIHLSFNNNKHFRQIWWYLKSCRAILNPV